jgi:hypothetical protein
MSDICKSFLDFDNVSDFNYTINFNWSNNKIKDENATLIYFLKERKKISFNESIYNDENELDELYVYITINNIHEEKFHFRNTNEEFYDGDRRIYPFSQLVIIITEYIKLCAQLYLCQKTFIERGYFSNAHRECFLKCDQPEAICEIDKCPLNLSRFDVKYPYIPAEECKIFISDFTVPDEESLSLLIKNDKENKDSNKEVQKAIRNLFFNRYNYLSENINNYQRLAKANIESYIEIQCNIIDTTPSEGSFLTTDKTFSKSNRNPWYEEKMFLKILASTSQYINNGITFSRVLIIDFDEFNKPIDLLTRLVPFYLINTILGIHIYIANYSKVLGKIQECDINFFIQSKIKNSGKLKLESSNILGIIDVKFPFIRIYENSIYKPLHIGYINYIENFLNRNILTRTLDVEKFNCLRISKELEKTIKDIIKSQLNDDIETHKIITKEIIKEILHENYLEFTEDEINSSKEEQYSVLDKSFSELDKHIRNVGKK